MSVTFRLPKDLSARLEKLRRRLDRDRTRTHALEKVIRRGLEREERLLAEID